MPHVGLDSSRGDVTLTDLRADHVAVEVLLLVRLVAKFIDGPGGPTSPAAPPSTISLWISMR